MPSPDPSVAAFRALMDALLPEDDVTEGTGFGKTPGLRTGGRIFAMRMPAGLVLKLPADRCAGMVAAGEAVPLETKGRSMREWVVVARPDPDAWLALAREARDFVGGR
ncbi:MAG: hypothetical protein AB7V62_08970 [Thermoleophilia bacterium]